MNEAKAKNQEVCRYARREGPGPSLRSCPRCGRGMQPAATLCGYCWLRMAPMGSDGVEPPPLPAPRPWWRF